MNFAVRAEIAVRSGHEGGVVDVELIAAYAFRVTVNDVHIAFFGNFRHHGGARALFRFGQADLHAVAALHVALFHGVAGEAHFGEDYHLSAVVCGFVRHADHLLQIGVFVAPYGLHVDQSELQMIIVAGSICGHAERGGKNGKKTGGAQSAEHA